MATKWRDAERDLGHKSYAAIVALVVSGGCYAEGTDTQRESQS